MTLTFLQEVLIYHTQQIDIRVKTELHDQKISAKDGTSK